jgi:hypothetical protein
MATAFRFRPNLESLEQREVPVAKLSFFASAQSGASILNSYLIRGTNGVDNVTVTEDPTTGAVAMTGVQVPGGILPFGNPVIIRVDLRGGNDIFTYLVQSSALPLVRQVEYIGGPGRNSFVLDSAAMPTTGANLAPSSALSITYDGAQGRVQNFTTTFGTVTASVVNLEYTFGAGNDRAINVAFMGAVDADSTVTGVVDLGSGSTVGTLANPANSFVLGLGNIIGAGDVLGTRMDFTVLGGPRTDGVRLWTNAWMIGTAPSRVTVRADLGGGADIFTLGPGGGLVLGRETTFQVQVHGGPGNDRLQMIDNATTPGGIAMLGFAGMFDLDLFGDAGNDRVQVLFSNNPVFDNVTFGAAATFRMRLAGGAGKDTVEASLTTGALGGITGTYDVQVRGGGGNDLMGLSIVDPVACIYRGGAALLDGGLGLNKLDPVIGAAGNVRRLNV